jgi:hypothetical protein
LALLVAPEAEGAVFFTHGLATIPSLLSDHGLALVGAAEAEAWWDSWSMEPPEGARLRGQLYPLAVQRLRPQLGEAGIEDVLGKNALSLVGVESVAAIIQSDAISSALELAKGYHVEAQWALRLGEQDRALELAFRTADALWEVTPEQVARNLISRAEKALGRNPDAASYSEHELIRIRRLMYGASEALDEGDYPRAIRRAYYACQLLGADSI